MATKTIIRVLNYASPTRSGADPTADAADGGTEYSHFEALASKLVQVPKEELGEKRRHV